MDRERGCEPQASELPDDIENSCVVCGFASPRKLARIGQFQICSGGSIGQGVMWRMKTARAWAHPAEAGQSPRLVCGCAQLCGGNRLAGIGLWQGVLKPGARPFTAMPRSHR
ncbi:MAG: hypothetical protein LBE86_00315 [Gemmobacter sp.]|jgi:hypothetical protein|nr:hypothetical protein [Gemmobacter sp.]